MTTYQVAMCSSWDASHFLLSDDNPNNEQLTTHNTNYKNILREYRKIGADIWNWKKGYGKIRNKYKESKFIDNYRVKIDKNLNVVLK